ncbi:MAG: M15 family metallopeptidase [Methylococcales bacterium]|nr:M15 family metallopeptidase [Methylococcales bacterium]MCK5477839.1 M15 family metallopeptidase [Methylococcales bacterium]
MKRFFSLFTLVLLYSTLVNASFSQNLPDAFVDIKDIIPNIKLEMPYYGADNFVGLRIDGYESPRCLLTKKAASALKKVQAELQTFGLGLKIYDAYRPQQAVDHFVRWAKDLNDTRMKLKYYPNVDKKNLFTDGYIAEKSGHSRGSTVDLTIVSFNSNKIQELDMGTRWDFFGPQSWPSNASVSPAQKAHRMLLQVLMTKHGFKPIKEEWWHFTLKDEPFSNTYFNFVIH